MAIKAISYYIGIHHRVAIVGEPLNEDGHKVLSIIGGDPTLILLDKADPVLIPAGSIHRVSNRWPMREERSTGPTDAEVIASLGAAPAGHEWRRLPSGWEIVYVG